MDAPADYTLAQAPIGHTPATLAELAAWLAKQSPSGRWFGKMYVATTISWDESNGVFRQRGCSPNYKAGWWTLACCKHDMRRSAKFKTMLNLSDLSVFAFTLAEKSTVRGSNTQALASVAKVTGHFPTMADYAKFILESGNHALISSRLSRERHDDGRCGWRFGDCHSNLTGAIGSPQAGHVHQDRDRWEWEDVNKGDHEILVSDTFLVWDRPSFSSVEMIKQARYGEMSVTCRNC